MKGLIVLAALSLAACSNREPLGRDFGNAVSTNVASQVVNPQPAAGPALTDGQRIDNAFHRYVTNTVYPPQVETGLALSSGASPGGTGGAAPGTGQ